MVDGALIIADVPRQGRLRLLALAGAGRRSALAALLEAGPPAAAFRQPRCSPTPSILPAGAGARPQAANRCGRPMSTPPLPRAQRLTLQSGSRAALRLTRRAAEAKGADALAAVQAWLRPAAVYAGQTFRSAASSRARLPDARAVLLGGVLGAVTPGAADRRGVSSAAAHRAPGRRRLDRPGLRRVRAAHGAGVAARVDLRIDDLLSGGRGSARERGRRHRQAPRARRRSA